MSVLKFFMTNISKWFALSCPVLCVLSPSPTTPLPLLPLPLPFPLLKDTLLLFTTRIVQSKPHWLPADLSPVLAQLGFLPFLQDSVFLCIAAQQKLPLSGSGGARVASCITLLSASR